jgi:hypothetical protein
MRNGFWSALIHSISWIALRPIRRRDFFSYPGIETVNGVLSRTLNRFCACRCRWSPGQSAQRVASLHTARAVLSQNIRLPQATGVHEILQRNLPLAQDRHQVAQSFDMNARDNQGLHMPPIRTTRARARDPDTHKSFSATASARLRAGCLWRRGLSRRAGVCLSWSTRMGPGFI